MLLEFEITSSKDGNQRENSRIEATEELTEPVEPENNDSDADSNIDVYRRSTPEPPETQEDPQMAVKGRLQQNRRMLQRYENAIAFKVNYTPSRGPVTLNSFKEAIYGKQSRE